MYASQRMRLGVAFGAAVVFLALIFAAHPPEAAAQAAGSITVATGRCEVQRGGAAIAAATGMAVNVGDRLVTGPDGHLTVLLTDGSRLELADSTSVLVDEHAGSTTHVSMASGILRSFVNFTTGGAPPNFEVHTPNAIAAARGTKYDTAMTDGISRPGYGGCTHYTDVSVYDGLVSFANAANPGAAVEVAAGYESTVPCDKIPTAPGPLGMTGASSMSESGGRIGGTGGPGAFNGTAPAVTGAPPPSCPAC
jgi:ferric-dicitrate binding protein FerR (iron transport regulator)